MANTPAAEHEVAGELVYGAYGVGSCGCTRSLCRGQAARVGRGAGMAANRNEALSSDSLASDSIWIYRPHRVVGERTVSMFWSPANSAVSFPAAPGRCRLDRTRVPIGVRGATPHDGLRPAATYPDNTGHRAALSNRSVNAPHSAV